jgi:hypothetical protein
VGAVAAEDEMGVRIDQARRDPAAFAVDGFDGLEGGRVGGGSGIGDAAADAGHDAVLDDAHAPLA